MNKSSSECKHGQLHRSCEICDLEQQLADAQLRIAVSVKIYELSPLHANGTFVVHPAHNMLYVLTMPMDELNQLLIEHPEYKERI